ncbi:hypothetical protein FACS1894125_5840 [Actinomycetota bacterium]|nr:hypothetical protein FACS1894125_5840 [Actinomycetota bacterium]
MALVLTQDRKNKEKIVFNTNSAIGAVEDIANILEEADSKHIKIITSDKSDSKHIEIRVGFRKSGSQAFWQWNAIDAVADAVGGQESDLIAKIDAENNDGKTKVTCSILDAKISQQKLYGFIPVGPVSVHGVTTYRSFCENLRAKLGV